MRKLNPKKVNDNHQEELYQATPEELKENRRLLQIQGDDSYLSTTAFLDRALKKAQVRAFISGQRSTNRNDGRVPDRYTDRQKA